MVANFFSGPSKQLLMTSLVTCFRQGKRVTGFFGDWIFQNEFQDESWFVPVSLKFPILVVDPHFPHTLCDVDTFLQRKCAVFHLSQIFLILPFYMRLPSLEWKHWFFSAPKRNELKNWFPLVWPHLRIQGCCDIVQYTSTNIFSHQCFVHGPRQCKACLLTTT